MIGFDKYFDFSLVWKHNEFNDFNFTTFGNLFSKF